LPPVPVIGEGALVAALHSEGRLLVFPASEVPELPRGKGNKLFGIPGAKAGDRSELMVAIAVVPKGGQLLVSSGERQMTLTAADLKDYRGERAQRGAVLPRGWRKVERIEAILPPP
jgi:topoisomerase-4 subunit A